MIEDYPTQAEFRSMEDEIISSIERRSVAQKDRRRAWSAGSLAVLTAVGAGAWVVLADSDARAYSAYCYAAASTASDHVQVGSPDDAPGHRRKGESLELCASVWRVGVFEGGRKVVPEDRSVPRPVPVLQSCLRPDGVPAVFPRPRGASTSAAQFCRAVGLNPPSGR